MERYNRKIPHDWIKVYGGVGRPDGVSLPSAFFVVRNDEFGEEIEFKINGEVMSETLAPGAAQAFDLSSVKSVEVRCENSNLDSQVYFTIMGAPA